MNEQVEKLLGDVSTEMFTTVARGVLGDDSVTLVGDPAYAEIDKPHLDDRTIGIVKVSGTAVTGDSGSHQNWSTVLKIVDQSVPTNDAAAWAFLRTRPGFTNSEFLQTTGLSCDRHGVT